jgi:hypothetical protein
MFNVPKCFGHYLPILRRLYTNAELVTCVQLYMWVGLRIWKDSSLPISWDQTTSTTELNSHHCCVRVVPPEDGQVMPETYRDTEHQWSVSESEVCIKLVVLLRNYVTMMHCQQNIKIYSSYVSPCLTNDNVPNAKCTYNTVLRFLYIFNCNKITIYCYDFP